MNTALARLRAKTDRQLAILIRRQLEQARDLSAQGRYAEAARIAEQMRSLMMVANLAPQERERIERMLELPATICA
jgi:hypothetical protein